MTLEGSHTNNMIPALGGIFWLIALYCCYMSRPLSHTGGYMALPRHVTVLSSWHVHISLVRHHAVA